MCMHAGGYMAYTYDRGSGLSPDLDHAPFQNTCNLNKLQTIYIYIYILKLICGHAGWVALPKGLPYPEVTWLIPANYTNFKP
jgi:hypothetical protein